MARTVLTLRTLLLVLAPLLAATPDAGGQTEAAQSKSGAESGAKSGAESESADETKAPSDEKPGAAESTAEKPGGGDQGPASVWSRLKGALRKARDARKQELGKQLEPFRPDLVLRYEGNSQFLDQKFAAIRELGPEIPELLVPLLFPENPDAAARHVAENALRVLRPLALGPWLDQLRAGAEKGPVDQRLRALELLLRAQPRVTKQELATRLEALLAKTPEGQVPHLLELIGRSEVRELGAKILPFLDRPKAQQRIGAMRALARLRHVPAVPKLIETAKSLDEPQGWRALLRASREMHPKMAPEGSRMTPVQFSESMAEILAHGERLNRVELLRAIDSLQELPSSEYRGGRGLILERLRPLLDHPFPQVTYSTALALRHLGDESGVEIVLERLGKRVKNNRRVPFVYLDRARAHEAFGMVREALKDVRDAIRYTRKGQVTRSTFLLAARLETKRGNASQVYQLLRDAELGDEDLRRFRQENAEHGLESLIERHRSLRKLFEG